MIYISDNAKSLCSKMCKNMLLFEFVAVYTVGFEFLLIRRSRALYNICGFGEYYLFYYIYVCEY